MFCSPSGRAQTREPTQSDHRLISSSFMCSNLHTYSRRASTVGCMCVGTTPVRIRILTAFGDCHLLEELLGVLRHALLLFRPSADTLM